MFLCFFFVPFENFYLTDNAVFENCHIVEKIETLKYHSYLCTIGGCVCSSPGHVGTMEENFSAVWRFQQINAP